MTKQERIHELRKERKGEEMTSIKEIVDSYFDNSLGYIWKMQSLIKELEDKCILKEDVEKKINDFIVNDDFMSIDTKQSLKNLKQDLLKDSQENTSNLLIGYSPDAKKEKKK